MHSRLVSWSRYAYLAGIVLALVLVIPTAWFPFQLAKLAVFSFLIAVAVVLFVVGGGAREFVRAHGFWWALAIVALPVSYLLSFLASTDKSLAFTGVGIESDTIVFVTLASVAFLFSFVLFRTLRMVRLLTTVVLWALAAAVIFQTIVIVFGLPFDIFADRSVNLIGKWNDLGLAAGLLASFMLVQLEMGSMVAWRRWVMAVCLALLTVLLGIINFSLVWAFLLAGSIALGIIKFLTMRRASQAEGASVQTAAQKVPWFAVAGVVISTTFLLFGSAFNSGLTSIVPVSSLEVRPSFSSTLDVIGAAREGSLGRALLGTGPNTFSNSWIMHKPAEVNQSLFWNLDFNVGFSTFVTAFGTVGLLGVLAWLVPLMLVLLGIIRVMRLSVLSREEKIAGSAVGLGSIFLIASILFYVPSASMILLAFVLSGATFGFLWRQGQPGASDDAQAPASSGVRQIASLGVMVVLVVCAVVLTFVIDRRFFSEMNTQHAQYALSQNDFTKGFALLASAQGIEKTRDNMRLAIDAGNLKLQQIASDQKSPAADLQKQFADTLTATIDAGKSATTAYPNDYQPALSLARVYDFLNTLKIEGAYDSAKQYYTTAQTLNPNNPQIPLALARLEAAKGSVEAAQTDITRALTLKPNYTDAILFVVQLNVANNDIPNAIKAATAAAQTAPGVGPIWFELGLLYYAAGDTKDAIPALEQAIKIVPDYANAKYFLGLSYYNEKRSAEAVAQFTELAKSNPDSEEVKLILANMQANKPPFESAQPPLSTNPAKRETAPLP
jgi:tetratricopeptide (TPR) repeat protein